MSNIVNTSFRQVSVKRLCTYEGVSGNPGQFLRSTGSSFEWGNGGGGSGLYTEQIQAQGGALNNLSLISPCCILKCKGNNTVISGLNVNGVKPTGGDVVIILNETNSYINILYNSNLSDSGNRFSTPSVSGQYLGIDGALMCLYDSEGDEWIVEVLDAGDPIPIAFNAPDYTLDGVGTFSITVEQADVKVFDLVQDGQRIEIKNKVENFTLAGPDQPTTVNIKLPFGFVSKYSGTSELHFPCHNKSGGTNQLAYAVVSADKITVFSSGAGAPWTLGANNCSIRSVLSFEIL